MAGESHPNARLTDTDIELIRTMYEGGLYGYRKLARIFECSRHHVRDIIKGKRR